MRRHFFAGLTAAALLAPSASAAPSYDCAKALSAAEKEICRVPDLQWFDRQLARLYKLAREQAGATTGAVIAAQRDFIVRREACRADYACLEAAYERRLSELAPQVNVYEAYAQYRREPGGTLWIARFGFDAAVKLLTVGDNGHTCAFEADKATLGGKGVVRWQGGACRVTIVPDGEDLIVEAKGCQDYCGMRAVLDGRYAHAR
jgi:uncharacterized protein